MNAPLIWIGFPFAAGFILLGFYSRPRMVLAAGASIALGLAVLAWLLPVDDPVIFRNVAYRVAPSFLLLGRPITISNEMTGMLGLVYTALFLWFFGAPAARPGRFFVPCGLMAVSLLITALSITPLALAGIFLLLAILLCIPILTPPGVRPARGVLQFLAFQAIGVPFLLIAASMLTGFEAAPPGLDLVARPSILLGFGFAFLLALFPFHAWIPRLMEEVHPYAAGFVLVFLPGFLIVIGFQLIDRNVWLRDAPEVFALIRAIALPSVIASGFGIAFQRHLGRIFGFAAWLDASLLLLAVGTGPVEGPELFFPLFAVRCFSLLVWSFGLAALRARGFPLDFQGVQGAGRVDPWAGAAVLVGAFSMAGLPFLLGFIPRLRLLTGLSAAAPLAAFFVWLAALGMLVAALRSLAVLVTAPGVIQADRVTDENPAQMNARNLLIAVGCLLHLAAGLLPHWVGILAEQLPAAFEHLVR